MAKNDLPERVYISCWPKGNSPTGTACAGMKCGIFMGGEPLVLEIIDQDGAISKHKVGNTFADDVRFQRLVPQNCWQRAYSTGRYSLVGCTVSPGFEFEDFEMIAPEKLAKEYPQIANEILQSPA